LQHQKYHKNHKKSSLASNPSTKKKTLTHIIKEQKRNCCSAKQQKPTGYDGDCRQFLEKDNTQ
jgi:hypothetical protein